MQAGRSAGALCHYYHAGTISIACATFLFIILRGVKKMNACTIISCLSSFNSCWYFFYSSKQFPDNSGANVGIWQLLV
jgi:hypothetical protein